MLRLQWLQARAAELARGGELDRAERLLLGSARDDAIPASLLELRARICAQGGRLADARRLWEALRDQPGIDATRPLALLAQWEAAPRSKRRLDSRGLLWLLLLVNVIVLLAAASWLLLRLRTSGPEKPEADPPAATTP